MPIENGDYYRDRARAELRIAAASSNETAKAIHLELARRYTTMARVEDVKAELDQA